jgi:hypothetical protein
MLGLSPQRTRYAVGLLGLVTQRGNLVGWVERSELPFLMQVYDGFHFIYPTLEIAKFQ